MALGTRLVYQNIGGMENRDGTDTGTARRANTPEGGADSFARPIERGFGGVAAGGAPRLRGGGGALPRVAGVDGAAGQLPAQAGVVGPGRGRRRRTGG